MNTIANSVICLIATGTVWACCAQQTKPKQINAVSMLGRWNFGAKTFSKTYKVNKDDTNEEVTTVQCNTCPEVVFKADGNGSIYPEGGGKLISVFSWKYNANTLSIFPAKNTRSNNTFLNGAYRIAHHKPIAGSAAIELIDGNNVRQLLIRAY